MASSSFQVRWVPLQHPTHALMLLLHGQNQALLITFPCFCATDINTCIVFTFAACLVITTATTYLVHVVQIVVVHGANPAGACVVAQKVYTSLPKAMLQSGLDQLQQSAQATGMHVSELITMFVLHCYVSVHPSIHLASASCQRCVVSCMPLDTRRCMFTSNYMNKDRARQAILASDMCMACCPYDLSKNETNLILVAGTAGMLLVVATGPFCCKDEMLYEPLQALLTQCSQKCPDVLVLLGPFVDANHSQVQDGTLAVTFEDVFQSQVWCSRSKFVQCDECCSCAFASVSLDFLNDNQMGITCAGTCVRICG